MEYPRRSVPPARVCRFGRKVFGVGNDLGGTLQFRLALGILDEVDDLSRVGLSFAHVSNASLYERTPGEGEIFLTYQIPF